MLSNEQHRRNAFVGQRVNADWNCNLEISSKCFCHCLRISDVGNLPDLLLSELVGILCYYSPYMCQTDKKLVIIIVKYVVQVICNCVWLE